MTELSFCEIIIVDYDTVVGATKIKNKRRNDEYDEKVISTDIESCNSVVNNGM